MRLLTIPLLPGYPSNLTLQDEISGSINPLDAADIAYASQLSQMQQYSTNGFFHSPDQWNPSFGVEQRRPPTFNASTGTSVPLPSVNRDGTGILNSSVTVTSHAMRTAANNRTKREARYQCQYCSDLLTTSAGLHNHINSHFGNKNFPCTTCGKAFVTKWDRKRHEKNLHGLTVPPPAEPVNYEQRVHFASLQNI
jgi:hypothetical protein